MFFFSFKLVVIWFWCMFPFFSILFSLISRFKKLFTCISFKRLMHKRFWFCYHLSHYVTIARRRLMFTFWIWKKSCLTFNLNNQFQFKKFRVLKLRQIESSFGNNKGDVHTALFKFVQLMSIVTASKPADLVLQCIIWSSLHTLFATLFSLKFSVVRASTHFSQKEKDKYKMRLIWFVISAFYSVFISSIQSNPSK